MGGHVGKLRRMDATVVRSQFLSLRKKSLITTISSSTYFMVRRDPTEYLDGFWHPLQRSPVLEGHSRHPLQFLDSGTTTASSWLLSSSRSPVFVFPVNIFRPSFTYSTAHLGLRLHPWPLKGHRQQRATPFRDRPGYKAEADQLSCASRARSCGLCTVCVPGR